MTLFIFEIMKKSLLQFFNSYYFTIGFVLVLIPYLIWLVLGENSFVVIRDNLDGNIVYPKLIIESGNMLGLDLQAVIPSVMNGLPRSFFGSGFNFTMLLFYLFPPIYAYILNAMFSHLVGYVGMYLFLKRYLPTNKNWLIFTLSFLWGILSYYHISFGLAIAGQPLLLYAFLNILYARSKWFDWVIVLLFPFFSFMVKSLPFYLPFLFVIGVLYWRKHKFPKWYFLAMFMITGINLLIEFNLVYSSLMGGYESHRSVRETYFEPTWNELILNFKLMVLSTPFHAGEFRTLPIIFLIFISIFFFKVKMERNTKYILLAAALILIQNYLWPIFLYYIGDDLNISILKKFNFIRFGVLMPFLWLLLMYQFLKSFDYTKMYQKIIGILCIAIVSGSIIYNNQEIKGNVKELVGKHHLPNYKQFFDEEVFNQIKRKIGEEDVKNYSVVSVGMHPSITQYNQFNTLDGYQNNYLLSYKKKFRKIIEAELDKSPDMRDFYDKTGNRSYVYSSELWMKYFFVINKNEKVEIQNLDVDLLQLKKMGAKYIFSIVPIRNLERECEFIGSFTTKASFWEVFVYRIK